MGTGIFVLPTKIIIDEDFSLTVIPIVNDVVKSESRKNIFISAANDVLATLNLNG